jgi:hypothetical protein
VNGIGLSTRNIKEKKTQRVTDRKKDVNNYTLLVKTVTSATNEKFLENLKRVISLHLSCVSSPLCPESWETDLLGLNLCEFP